MYPGCIGGDGGGRGRGEPGGGGGRGGWGGDEGGCGGGGEGGVGGEGADGGGGGARGGIRSGRSGSRPMSQMATPAGTPMSTESARHATQHMPQGVFAKWVSSCSSISLSSVASRALRASTPFLSKTPAPPSSPPGPSVQVAGGSNTSPLVQPRRVAPSGFAFSSASSVSSVSGARSDSNVSPRRDAVPKPKYPYMAQCASFLKRATWTRTARVCVHTHTPARPRAGALTTTHTSAF